MIFPTTISLILALAPATLFAAPTRTVDSIARRHLPAQIAKKLVDGVCDLGSVVMPTAPTPLPAPAFGLKLSHVALGIGTQNYTCAIAAPTVTPVPVGAVAQLYNVTCQSVRVPSLFIDLPRFALDYGVPTADISEHLLSGYHEFTADGAPLFVLNTDTHKYGYIQAKKNGTSAAPADAPKGANGLGSVAWLKLTATEGDYKEVYRVDTAGGMAPKTCEGVLGDFQVHYSTFYYFWK